MSSEVTPTPEVTPQVKNSIFNFLNYFIISRFFVILIGMFIGAGLVLKFNPEPKILRAKIDYLESENLKLKKQIDMNMIVIKNYQGEVRNSVKLP